MHHNMTLGILGGGQLGRMSALAAARLGISVITYCPEENTPASAVSKKTITASYDDETALKKFSEQCDVITYEFENIPVKTIDFLESLKPRSVFPKQSLLHVSQNRIEEKSFLNAQGLKTARWVEISSLDNIKTALELWETNGFVIKTARFGYDGKGQIKGSKDDLHEDSLLHDFLIKNENQPLVMEEMIDFSHEISVIIARDIYKDTGIYGPMLNAHKNHILHQTTVPSRDKKKTITAAIDATQTIADAVDLTGVLTVEMFVLPDDSILINEIAPRTHNSGHWSIDACAVSQFENHVRTVCGLPVGSTVRHNDAVMLNLIGDDINEVDQYLNAENTNVHLYGKTESRAGRKMGHVTFLKTLT